MERDALSIVLIGCGGHSESAHASTLAHFVTRHPGTVVLTAACDLDLERAARFCRDYGFARAYSDWETMLEAEKPDAVISVLPMEKIGEVGSELLRRHIPCVLEKPPGISLEEATALADLADQTGTPHQVSMNRRFSPYLSRAIAWAQQNGPLHYIRGQMLRHARREDDFLWGTGVHVVDAMCFIGGDIARVDVQRLAPSSRSPAWFLITLEFASGIHGYIEILPTVGVEDEVFELFGEGYRARVHTMGGKGESVRCWKNRNLEVEVAADPDDPLFLRNGSYEETAAFLHALREGTPLRPTLRDVLPALQVCAQQVGAGSTEG